MEASILLSFTKILQSRLLRNLSHLPTQDHPPPPIPGPSSQAKTRPEAVASVPTQGIDDPPPDASPEQIPTALGARDPPPSMGAPARVPGTESCWEALRCGEGVGEIL